MTNVELAVPYTHIKSITEKHSQQLSDLLRYARFIESETPEEWVKLLGPDVVGLTHPEVTAEIAEKFMVYNAGHGIKLSSEEQVLFLTMPWVHDWGELIIEGQGVGDVTFEQKTQDHEKVELIIVNLLLGDVDDTKVRNLLRQAYTEVTLDKTSTLGQMFNAVERIGYLLTGIRAYEGVESRRIANWRGLVGNVVSNQIVKLLEYRTEYPYVDEVLILADDTIDRMFTNILSERVPLDNTGNASYDLAKFQKAQKAWSTRVKIK